MKFIIFIGILFYSFLVFSQTEDRENEENEIIEKTQKNKEFGIDGVVKASTIGGSYGFGARLCLLKNENIVYGPSLRFQRIWSNYNGVRTYFNGGLFINYRYKNIVFAAAELEFLRSPLNYNLSVSANRWVPILLLGGGISREFPIGIRINAGVYYDIVNSVNSPLQFSYLSRNAQGKLQPIIYRVGFHFLI